MLQFFDELKTCYADAEMYDRKIKWMRFTWLKKRTYTFVSNTSLQAPSSKSIPSLVFPDPCPVYKKAMKKAISAHGLWRIKQVITKIKLIKNIFRIQSYIDMEEKDM